MSKIDFLRCDFDCGKRWIVERELDGKKLTVSGSWSNRIDPRQYKLYKRQSAALKALERYNAPMVQSGHFETRGRILAVYHGDIINLAGKILKKADFELSDAEKSRIQFFVNRLHCGESWLFVAREVRRGLRKSWSNMPPALRREILEHALGIHRANREIWKAYS